MARVMSPIQETFDVAVVGGGMAGVCAALSASRAGATVCLIEGSNLLGGCTTLAMVQPWQGFFTVGTPDNPHGKQVVFGIAQEIVEELVKAGGSLGHLPDPIGFSGSITPINTATLPPFLAVKLQAEGVSVILGSSVVGLNKRGNRITTLFCERSGIPGKERLAVRAKFFIDASGSAVLFALAREDLIIPEKPQAWTHIFTVAPVDEDEIRNFIEKHPKDFALSPNWKNLKPRFTAVSGFFSLVKRARESGEFPCPRDRLLFFGGVSPSEITVNTTRVFPPKGYYRLPLERQAQISARLRLEALAQVYELSRFLKRRVPGFSKADIHQLAPQIGIRENCRLMGKSILRGRDVLLGKIPKDSIAVGGYPIDIHAAGSEGLTTAKVGGQGIYGIPLRALMPRNLENAIAAGRIISADSVAFASSRITAIVMAVGEKAGIYAARMAQGEKPDIGELTTAYALQM